jgi:hypothetical protein
MTCSVQNMRNGRGNGAGLFVGRRVRVRSVNLAKMAFQISMIETPANQENRCSTLQAPVRSAKLPTRFVGGVSSGKSRLKDIGLSSSALCCAPPLYSTIIIIRYVPICPFSRCPSLGMVRKIADDTRRRSFIWEILDKESRLT